ncbi:XTP/dITP diphosphatase [Priestia taiwanensis]|uniref:dITP/XTP pyrophosphatase n=1 Tax=Priestia taiwanensis TaxID=1347902 RepID=A0A917AUF8_9BACI|nr:XTP/dITP diphosphatase [Priestia taiwanensis]MBM7363551.1 XTP/dITP diphosphohydrolase [Priestia taiwanensis]GGE76174.1 non-canonical purine NTP pyrophosphatase [Priestia taiwanensis]
MKTIVIATNNRGKVKDFETLFKPLNVKVKSLHDFPELEEVEETGETFEENAILKAESISKQLNEMVVADDSGLIVDALSGRPGVYSARYAGPEKNDKKNYEKLLQELGGVEEKKRTARFYCALALATPGEETIFVNGTCEGKIAQEPAGENGFGYDPVFYVEEKKRTMAQLTAEEKAVISHRSEALRKLTQVLTEKMGK